MSLFPSLARFLRTFYATLYINQLQSMESTGNRRPWSEGRKEEEIAAVAYSTVEGIEFLEPNDGKRLGYHVYRYLTGELSSVKVAVQEAKARTPMHPAELERTIAERLAAAGVPAA